MSVLETAKDLLRKGIALNDAELIAMANQLIADNSPAQEPEVAEQPKEKPTRKVSVDDFSMPERSEAKGERHVPVNSIKDRVNQFIDDKSEHTDITTPEITLTERRSPTKMISQKCQECGRDFQVHESHRREWFVCDSCLSGRRR